MSTTSVAAAGTSTDSPIEAGGRCAKPGDYTARFLTGAGTRIRIPQGTRTYLLQDEAGKLLPTHSVSAGLDYPAIGPEHALLHDQGRVRYTAVGDDQAKDAFRRLSQLEGIIPALESAHAVAWVIQEAASLAGKTVLINLSGRGDKDLGIVDL